MGTRGTYGFRKNGVDKLTYNHWDSYPDGLGKDVTRFCKNHSVLELYDIFNRIIMVDQHDVPTPEQIQECIDKGFTDFSVSSKEKTDWYCLLRKCQGNLDCYAETKDDVYMIDNQDFIKDSLWCEYGYIINLDDEVLEFWKGFQEEPQENNRYGTESNRGYYPCKLESTIPLNEINDVYEIVAMMNKALEESEE